MSINGREQLTRADIKRIQEEIDHRRLVVRPAALEALKTARAMGDLSENFEYHCAKRDNNQNNSRIRYLEKLIRTAIIVEEEADEEKIGLNDTVELYFAEDDETETYRIVTSIRSDTGKGAISNESPLGAALMGHKAGDEVEVKLEKGLPFKVQIRSVKKTGELSEDTIRRY